MGLGTGGRLHQHYREALIPGLGDVFAAAKHAGAHGVALSGSYSSVITLTHKYPQTREIVMRKMIREIMALGQGVPRY